MTAMKVFLLLLLVMFLIGRVRLGGMVEYSAQGLLVQLRLGAVWYQIYPGKKKEKRKKSPQKQKKKKNEPSKKKIKDPEHKAGSSLSQGKRYLPLVGEAAGGLKKRISIDRLLLDLVVASENAAGTAMTYGYANAVLGMLWSVFEENFRVKEHRLRTVVDFMATNSTVYLNAAFSIRIGQLVSFALRMLWCFFRLYRQGRGEK